MMQTLSVLHPYVWYENVCDRGTETLFNVFVNSEKLPLSSLIQRLELTEIVINFECHRLPTSMRILLKI